MHSLTTIRPATAEFTALIEPNSVPILAVPHTRAELIPANKIRAALVRDSDINTPVLGSELQVASGVIIAVIEHGTSYDRAEVSTSTNVGPAAALSHEFTHRPVSEWPSS